MIGYKNRIRLQFSFWTLSIGSILLIGLYYFPKEFGDHGFWKTLYYSLRLFIFEHDHDRFPTSYPLVAIYFIAPLLTLSGIGTALTYLFKLSPSVKMLGMRDHVIICGMGRTGKLFARSLKNKQVRAVGVDIADDEEMLRCCELNGVSHYKGNFLNADTLTKAKIHDARSIIFASGNDLANIEGGMLAYELIKSDKGTPRIIWVQITNENLAETTRFFLETSGAVHIRIFDTYRIAAQKMIHQYFRVDKRTDLTEIDILGFGKFGRDLMEMMIRDFAKDEKIRLRVIDMKNCASEVEKLAREMGYEGKVDFKQADIQDLHMIYHPDKAYFVCTDDDLKNLTTAMSLARKMKTERIFVRMAHWPFSAVSEKLGTQSGIQFINITNLVLSGIHDLPGIFEPATSSNIRALDADRKQSV